MDKQELSKYLNPAQAEAASHTTGPLLILAGAGSGKTRVLTYRVAHLIASEGVDPRRILAITFTNKAASELRQRVLELLDQQAIKRPNGAIPWVGTFHALGSFILRRSIQNLKPYTSDFSIYDSSQQLNLVKAAIKALKIDPEALKPKVMVGTIGRYKNEDISVFSKEQLDKVKSFGFKI